MTAPPPPYQVRFQKAGARSLLAAFPCDAAGTVDLDVLADEDRHQYLFMRAVSRFERFQVEIVSTAAR